MACARELGLILSTGESAEIDFIPSLNMQD